MKTEREWREDVLRRLERLAGRRANDAVKLAFLGEDALERIDGMDLSGLTEFKRHGNGAVEVKLVDRVAALEKLYAFAGQNQEGFRELLGALRASTERDEAG